jgi:hypothetical protein
MPDARVPTTDDASDALQLTHRPREHFWPYLDVTETPTEEELLALDPELRTALYGTPPGPFSLTLVFPRFEGDEYARALEIARGSAEYREVGHGVGFRSRARFTLDQVEALRDLFQIVGTHEGCEVLIDDSPVPYARELWLPLVWYLLPR